eukprot:scaffold517_cov392-Prasinococcus_capsulatus_cf.AAC.18
MTTAALGAAAGGRAGATRGERAPHRAAPEFAARRWPCEPLPVGAPEWRGPFCASCRKFCRSCSCVARCRQVRPCDASSCSLEADGLRRAWLEHGLCRGHTGA